ncbi:hypothetical protein [Streptomyces sp. CBMA29]|uniref:hypothetical protein n=1 Tax=Streptomyces sp. CBMA29 TaxID=1896314 RepID=UPI0016621923|nr:hypothetical protein [Streptomyces sp. CBMA29]
MFDHVKAGEAFSRLNGVRFVEVGRIGGMAILGFGDTVSWELEISGRIVEGAEFALHIGCPFRILQASRIVLGSDDIDDTPSGGQGEDPSDVLRGYDRGARNLEGFLTQSPIHVVSVRVTEIGDFSVELEHGIRIEAFPTSAKIDESWRFLARFGEHVVF